MPIFSPALTRPNFGKDGSRHLVTTNSRPAGGWLKLDGEDRPWIYSNPIYVR